MAQTIKLRPASYSDTAYVEGVARRNPIVQRDFYIYCKTYFDTHYRGVFFASDHDKQDIFHNTYITLWENIERGRIRVRDGILIGRDDKPFQGSLLTYMMGIGKLKYREWVRTTKREPGLNDCPTDNGTEHPEATGPQVWTNEDTEPDMLETISDCVAVMQERCRQILTKFYYENKRLDIMLSELPTYKSKDALKSNKNRCLNLLKTSVTTLYNLRKEE
ncbi:MAG: hypothetical protein NC388_07690 [Clostridium sp.]|nr:hypothetical protein [Clostridium sp.]